jgi:hypothetical protein
MVEVDVLAAVLSGIDMARQGAEELTTDPVNAQLQWLMSE